uniref:uncharacterized protein LOC122607520 n=1 Tax=Erigeron canadensis TaxID=72917 RepID=UPI001CB89A12|nr:uncharacterized protein LOC122607520 [Erigeron canadensis]
MTKTKERAWRNSDSQPLKREAIPSFKIRFPTDDAASKYKMYTTNRDLFMERGFTDSESDLLKLPDSITRVIEAHKWETFCQNPSSASIPLVREFYANYDPEFPNLVRVRGKLVNASASAINSLYLLTDHQISFFESGSKSKVLSLSAMRDIILELTGKRVTCKRAKNMYISREDLKAGLDIWVMFIKFNLLPTPYDTAISKDRAILLYCIMLGKPINVGKVIAKQIRKCASLKSGDLWFPSLITRLCRQHYVRPSGCEAFQQPDPPLLLDELVESESDQETNPSNKKSSKKFVKRGCFNPKQPAEATEIAPSIYDSSRENPLPTPLATSSESLPPVVSSAPSAEPSSPSLHNSSEVTVPPVTPLAPAAEPSSPPQADFDELPRIKRRNKRLPPKDPYPRECAWINTENRKKKQKTTTKGSISSGNPQPLGNVSPMSDSVSSPQCGTICVQGYNVKRNVAPILEAIFKKHGDIAAECMFKTASAKSHFLEVVCEVVVQIETGDVIEKMKDIECRVSDAEAVNINVAWLRADLEALHLRKGAMKRSDLLMETKVNMVKRAAQIDLRKRCEELMAAQERFLKAERCARVLHLVEKNIKNKG